MDIDSGISIKIDPGPATKGKEEIDAALKQTEKALDNFSKKVDETGKRTKKSFDELGSSADKGAKDVQKAARSQEEAAASARKLAEEEEKAKQRIKEMVAASLAQQKAAFESAKEMDNASRAVVKFTGAGKQGPDALRQSFDALQKEISEVTNALSTSSQTLQQNASKMQLVEAAYKKGILTEKEYTDSLKLLKNEQQQIEQQAQRNAVAMQQLINKYDPASAALQKLTVDEQRLNAALKQGIITREQYTKASAGLTVQRAAWKAQAEAVEDTAVKINKLAFTSTQAFRDYATFLSALSRGDVQMAGNQILQLSARSGALRAIMSPLGATIAGVSTIVTGLAVAFKQGEREQSAFNLAIATTGNYAGVTAGQLEQLAQTANDTTQISRSAARSIAVAMIQSGKVGGEVIANLTNTVATFAAATGQDVEQAAKSLTSLFEKPTAGALELSKQFNVITPRIYSEIAALEKDGKVKEAQIVLSKALADSLRDDLGTSLGFIERAWSNAAKGASNFWDTMKGIGRDKSPEKGIAETRAEIGRLQKLIDMSRGTGQLQQAQQLEKQLASVRDQLEHYEMEADRISTKAADDAETTEKNRKAVAGQVLIDGLMQDLRTSTEQYEDVKKKVDEAYANLGRKDDAQKAVILERLAKRYQDKDITKADNAFDRKRIDLINATTKAQNELLNVQKGLDESTNQHTIAIEAWITESIRAKDLTVEQAAELRKLAAAADDAERAQSAGKAIAQLNKDLERQIEMLEVQTGAGKQAALALAELEAKYGLVDAGVKDVTAAMTALAPKYEQLKKSSLALATNDIVTSLKEQTEELRLQAIYGDQAATSIERLRIQRELEAKGGKGGVPKEVDDALRRRDSAGNDVVISGMEREYALSQMTNLEREKTIALSRLSTDATVQQRQAVEALVEAQAAETASKDLQSMGIDTTFMQVQAEQNVIIYERMYAEIDALEQARVISEQDASSARMQIWAQEQSAKMQAASSFFGNLAQLQKSKNKEMARIGKAAAIAQAIIKTYEAANNAYSSLSGIPYVGPALGIAAAAAAIAAGMANVQAIRSQNAGFKKGGWTGNIPRNQVAGDVHGQEFVMNAPATARIGREDLSALQAGTAKVTRGNAAEMPKLNVTVQNYGTSKTHEVQQLSPTDIRVIARDEAMKQVQTRVPDLVSSEINNPNSKISKSMNRSTQTQRRR